MKRATALTGALFCAAICLAWLVGPAAADDPIIIKFNHVVPESSPKGQAAARFAEIVNERLKGRVEVQVFANAQLYDEDAAFDALLVGDLQMTAPTLAKCLPFTKKLQVFDLPFLFNDISAVDRFQQSETGKELLNSMLEHGLKGLRFGREGMKQLHAKVPLRVPSDAKGLKFRIMASDVIAAQMDAVGGYPQKMAFSEVYNALQTGVIDAHENTWSLIWSRKFFEAAKYITESNHGVLDYVIITNASFWDGLPDDIRSELEKIMAEVGEWEYALERKQTQEDRQKIIDTGIVEVLQLTPEQREQWREAMLPVWDKFEKEIGRDVIEAAMAANDGS